MTICNSCRYCEGLCPVFQAMELRRSFEDGDLDYLANLCHNCGACYSDCQYAPPHEFSVNVPRTLAQVRGDSYRHYAWPAAFRPLFDRNGLAVTLFAVLGVAGFILGFVGFHDPRAMFATYAGRGAFYRLMPHEAMAWLFLVLTAYVVLALVMGLANFWRDIGGGAIDLAHPVAAWRGLRDALQLRHLDGGGQGCVDDKDDGLGGRRRVFHHLTFYGFLLCFGSTSVATAYHYLLGLEAPYPWYDLPVLLGVAGGIGLVLGPIGLLRIKYRRDPMLTDPARLGMDNAFLLMLLATGLSGLALTAFRETPAMASLLALHLGIVFGLFLAMPYSKFVHGFYRTAALLHFHAEKTAPSAATRRAAAS